MASYTTDMTVFVIKNNYSLRGCCVIVKREEYCREDSVLVPPSRDSIRRITKHSEETGTVCKGKYTQGFCPYGRSCGCSKRGNNKFKKMCTMLTQPIETPSNTARKICRDVLPLSPYTMQLSQPLSEDGTAWRYALGGSAERN
jgi:hypothetical protein